MKRRQPVPVEGLVDRKPRDPLTDKQRSRVVPPYFPFRDQPWIPLVSGINTSYLPRSIMLEFRDHDGYPQTMWFMPGDKSWLEWAMIFGRCAVHGVLPQGHFSDWLSAEFEDVYGS